LDDYHRQLIKMVDILNTGWILLQLLAITVFFFWLTCANEEWSLFLGLELVAVVLLFTSGFGLWVIGIDINNHQWLTGALITWPLVAMLAFQLVNTFKKFSSRVNKEVQTPLIEPRQVREIVVENLETETISASVHEIVERAAAICRKYALWHKEQFAEEFLGIDDSVIRSAWSNALERVKDDEIIGVSTQRKITSFIGNGLVSEVVGKAEYEDDQTNFSYLMSKLDGSTLSPPEEDREREIRRLLALRYVIRSRGAAFGENNELLGSFVVPKGQILKE
jgi:hypothetical protein